MNDKFNYKKEIFLDTEIEKIWDFLTKSEYTKQYMYNVEASSYHEVESPITLKDTYEGQVISEKKIISCVYTTYKSLKYSEVESANPLIDKEYVGNESVKKMLPVLQGILEKIKKNMRMNGMKLLYLPCLNLVNKYNVLIN